MGRAKHNFCHRGHELRVPNLTKQGSCKYCKNLMNQFLYARKMVRKWGLVYQSLKTELEK